MQAYSIDDIYRHRVLGPLHASAHSEHMLLTVKRARRKKDGYDTSLWLCSPQSRRRIVDADVKPSSARVSRDGTRVAYFSRRKQGRRQIVVLDIATMSTRDVGEASSEWQSIQEWSPDGARLLVTRKIAWAEDARDDTAARKRPIVVTHLPYKQDGGGVKSGYRTLLVELDVVTGTQRTLAQGDFDVQGGYWSPDGRLLAFVRTREGTQRHFSDLWLANADGSQVRRITHELPAVNNASWSPDASRIALAAGEIEGDSLAALYVADVVSGKVVRATRESLHLEPPEAVWHDDGRRVAVVASVRGLHRIAVVDVDAGTVRLHPGRMRHVVALARTRDALVYVAASMRRPDELFRSEWDGRDERRLSRFNRGWTATRAKPHVAKRRFTVPDGRGGDESIEAWVLTPAQGDGPWPVLVDMHGGPHSDTLVDFSNHLYWYLLLSRGWMIVSPNAVGSSGYGDEFARRLRGAWGELDLPQVLTVLGELRARGIAGEVAACGGKSYGGFLSAYAAGHCEAFERVVVSAPVSDIESHFGTSDSGYYVMPYAMDGDIAAHRARYHALSPLCEIEQACGPVLLLQGQADERCPLDQSEELFAALVRAGRPAKMVVYPDGAHGMAANGRPSHRADYHQRFADWVAGLDDATRSDNVAARANDEVPEDNVSEAGAVVRQVGAQGSPARE